MEVKKKDENNKPKKLLYKILLVVFLIAFLVCAIVLARNAIVQKRAEDLYADMASESVVEETEEAEPEMESETETETETEELDLLAQKGIEIPEKNLDWDALYEENEDIYAWIYIPNTQVDYPILQHPTDMNYYLDRNVDGSSGYPGCIYTQNINSKDFMDPMTVLYGHNMKNGSMFHTLHDFEDGVFFDENKYVYIYMPDVTYVYEILAAYTFSDKHLLYTYDFETPESFDVYLDEFKCSRGMTDHVREDMDVEVNGYSHVITLSTCISGKPNNRWLVQAVMVNDPMLAN